MTITGILVVCLIAHPTQCQSVRLKQNFDSVLQCMMAGELAAAERIDDALWRFDRVRCTPGIVDEHNG
jgi:hypothetical protein